jgi:hypothetical protein
MVAGRLGGSPRYGGVELNRSPWVVRKIRDGLVDLLLCNQERRLIGRAVVGVY